MISDVYFPRVNGVSTSIQTFRCELEALGHETHLIAPAYPAAYPDEPDTVRVPSGFVPFDPEDRRMHPGAIRKIADTLADSGFDLVHVQTPFVAHYLGLEIARRLGVPCVETYHTFFEEYLFHYVPLLPKDWLRAVARRFSRTQANRVDALVVPSTAMREVLDRYGVVTPMHVIPTGIPPGDFRAGDGQRFRAALHVAAGTPLLLFVGRVAHEKNIAFLLRAFVRASALMPGLEFVIAGEGPARRQLKRETARLGLGRRVHFVGYLDRRTALADCYAAADAFVFASRTETQGLVLLEAMAVGLPVISTAVMGTRDIVGPRRGALVPADDEGAFAEAIVRLASDPDLRARLSCEAREYAREWHADTLAERLAALYREVVDAASPGPVVLAG